MKTIILLLITITSYSQTKDSVYSYLKEIGVKHPEIVLRQSIQETKHFECVNCSLEHNNIFGFRLSKKYIKFGTWQQSCDYYLIWQNKWYKGNDYYDFLNCIWKHRNGSCARYASDPLYTQKLKQIRL